MKYFIDNEIYYKGKKQPPRKTELVSVIPDPNGKTALCCDKDGNEYTLPLTDILEETEATNENIIPDTVTENGDIESDVRIILELEMEKFTSDASFDFTVSNGLGGILIMPVTSDATFTNVAVINEENIVDDIEQDNTKKFTIKLNAQMCSPDRDLRYSAAIDDIGQVIIAPVSETSDFTACVLDEEDNEQVVETLVPADEEGPYPRNMIETDLRSLTHDFTIKGDTLKSGYKEEQDYAVEILSKYYNKVETRKEGNWYIIDFSQKRLNEADMADKEQLQKDVIKELCSEVITDLENLLVESIDKCNKIIEYFDRLDIHSADIEPYVIRYLESFINDRAGEACVVEFRQRLDEMDSDSEGEIVESVSSSEDFDEVARLDVINRFMQGEITIITHEGEPNSDHIHLKELDAENDSEEGMTYRYYYDRDADAVICFTSRK